MNAADMLQGRILSQHYRHLVDLHLNAAERHVTSDKTIVDARVCNGQCANAEDPSEPHIDAAVRLGQLAAREATA